MPLNTGFVLNSRYRIVSLLGEGGFGAVYRAWDLNLKRPCAVKENLDTSPEAQEQFQREALILANLINPNLARVIDHFFLPNLGQYLVMDFVEGEDLFEILERTEKPIEVEDAVKWVSQVCDALTYMHSRTPPIIHRDIKPANIKITPEGNAMLVDFGIAKVYDPKLRTTVGARAITPGYSPPEQYGQGKTDPRSDIYALGATMYTMLTDRVPPDSVDILTGNQDVPPPVRELNPAVSQELSDAVAKAMQVERNERFESAADFKEALAASLRSTVKVEAPEMASVQPAQAETPLVVPVQDQETRFEEPETESRSRRILWVGVLTLVLALIAVGLFAYTGTGWFESSPPESDQNMDEKSTGSEGANQEQVVPGAGVKGELTLWYSLNPVGPQKKAMDALLARMNEIFPDLVLNSVSMPREEIAQRYPDEGSRGEPDILITDNVNLTSWVDGGLMQPLNSLSELDLSEFHPAGLGGMNVDGQLFGIPLAAQGVGIYYNNAMIHYPPEDIAALSELNHEAAPLASRVSAYFLHGFFAAFGASLFDEEGRCVLSETNGAAALAYLQELQNGGALYLPEEGGAERTFLDEESGMLINGPWALPEYRNRFGEMLGFVPLPAGPGGMSASLLSFTGAYINPHSKDLNAAVAIVEFLSSQEAGQILATEGVMIPVRWDIEKPDPIQEIFFEAMDYSDTSITRREFANYWEPFDQMFIDVLVHGAPPDDALNAACAEMNRLNGK